jgi:hypothetical protein
MLTTTFDRLSSALLTVDGDKAIGILLANMPLIRKMVLSQMRSVVGADKQVARTHSPEDDNNESANFTGR